MPANSAEKESHNKEDTNPSIIPYEKLSDNSFALINLRLIDGTGSKPMNDQTIIVKNGDFHAVGDISKVSIPDSMTVIDLQNKTVVPGFVGMHNHLHIPRFPDIGHIASRLYLAAGVTTIQTSGATNTELELRLADSIHRGTALGPEIVVSAPYITGPGGNRAMMIPENEQHIRRFIQKWVNRGVSWFKVYRHTKTADLAIIIDEAHKHKAKVRGHLCSITYSKAVELGIDGIEHGLNAASDFQPTKNYDVCIDGYGYIDDLDINSPTVRKVMKDMIDNGVFLNSTLAIIESGIPARGYIDERALPIMSQTFQKQYHDRRARYDDLLNDESRENRFKKMMAFDYQFFQMGGLLCSGSDAGRHVLPGMGDQRNYELFIEAGFSPEEAIKVMTSNGALALGREDIGSVRAGKRADFIILNGDLEKDSSVIKNTEMVFKNGIGYAPSEILKQTEGAYGVIPPN
ncbi:amidohydrolase family protein [Marinicella sp. W31]|uniref:amidohydrolase family protein n=1 Tax=Marinicella sp. W31 TaxID=3023713 RepID=UPI00375766EA